ncbi:MAG TPA: hypothetical protein VK425_11695 [Acidimicrobiales bacterium]|nr:hypothetical protein [Acidimicrobiales bacterium]
MPGRHSAAIKGGAGRLKAVSAGLLAVAIAVAVGVETSGHRSGPGILSVSVASGPPGTLVQLSGTAGANCTLGRNWSGFEFERDGGLRPSTEMAVPIASNGLWTATFVVPSYLGGPSPRSEGERALPGRYEFAARACDGRSWATAPFRVTRAIRSPAPVYVGIVATPDGQGYWLATSDGGVSAFGDAAWYGSLTAERSRPAAPVVGVARVPDGRGYWLVGADGRVYNFGDARLYSALPGTGVPTEPVAGIAATPDGHGYWLVGTDGRVYGFGDATVDGGADGAHAPYQAIVARPGGGYLVAAADAVAAYAFPGGSRLEGGGAVVPLSSTLIGAAASPSGKGVWQVNVTGGVFTSGDASFYGSLPSDHLVPDAPVTGIAATPDGHGYWLVGADGAVFSFGDARFFGMSSSSVALSASVGKPGTFVP